MINLILKLRIIILQMKLKLVIKLYLQYQLNNNLMMKKNRKENLGGVKDHRGRKKLLKMLYLILLNY